MSTPHNKLRPPGAAKYVGLAESTLAKLRMGCDGPAFHKLGRAVVYDRDDLDTWLAAHRIETHDATRVDMGATSDQTGKIAQRRLLADQASAGGAT